VQHPPQATVDKWRKIDSADPAGSVDDTTALFMTRAESIYGRAPINEL